MKLLPPIPGSPTTYTRPCQQALPLRQHFAALLVAILTFWVPGRALAYKNGAATEGCEGCHNGGKPPTVTITPDLQAFNPGQTINLTVSISQTNGPVAGFYIESGGIGMFTIVDSGTKLGAGGVTHTAPRTGSGGFTTFKVAWTAPASPGGVDFYVWANSANGDGTPRGDAEGDGFFSTAFGCAGNKYYHDYDGDGVGAISSGYTVTCSVPQYYSAKAGDCDDNDPTVYPGATEVCDGKDNNCDGQIDEGLPFKAYCTDADGDGHGVSGMATMMACGVRKGWGLCDNDCNDSDPTIYPGAPELCNNKDDNCNGQVDEGARTTCGVGWCARYADGCSAAAQSCTPGAPRAEECNDFDDDCDGVKDNGTDLELCKVPGLVCRSGYCVAGGGGGAGGAANSGGSGAVSGSLNAGGSSGSTQPSAPAGTASTPEAPPPGCALTLGPRPRTLYAALALLLASATLGRRKRRAP